MTKVRRLGLFSLGFVFILLLVVIPCFALPPEGKQTTLKYATTGPPTGDKAKWDKWFGAEIEKRTNGRVKVEYYFAQSLLKNKEMLIGVKNGVADLGMFGAMWFPAQIPLQTAFSMPALGPPIEFSQDPGKPVKVIWELWDNVPALREEMKRWNQTMWATSAFQPYELFSKVPINSLGDLKGLRVRELGAKGRILYQPFGAIPVAVSPPELYGALQKGILDAVSGGLDWGDRFALKEVARYLVLIHFNSGTGITTMNMDTIGKLQPKDRDIVLEVGRDYSFKYAEEAFKAQSDILKRYQKAGVTVKEFPKTERDKWRDMCETKIIEAWLEQVGKTGGSVSDAREVIGKYLSAAGAASMMPK